MEQPFPGSLQFKQEWNVQPVGKRMAGIWCLYYNENTRVVRFPGSSMVEHSAVNRRVASSNLARGAIL
jgi:hypothetical protein